jgi:hypothetical protein
VGPQLDVGSASGQRCQVARDSTGPQIDEGRVPGQVLPSDCLPCCA